MVTRRRFLGQTALGTLGLLGGCTAIPPLRGENAAAHSVYSEAAGADAAVRFPTKDLLLGYPVNMTMPSPAFFAWRRQLQAAGIGCFAYNNVGNPFDAHAMQYNTHDHERAVIEECGRQYGFAPSEIWGFVSNSGTDSNLHGMYMGRTLLKARTQRTPKAYFTAEAHYSIQILQDLLGLERVWVRTRPDGGMDPDDLRRQVHASREHPALVVATLGTTFKGAIDPLDEIQQALSEHSHYLHLDAALFGGYLPYTRFAADVGHRTSAGVQRFDSIAVSCHKFFGFPAPAGLFMTRASSFDEFHREFSRIHNPEYIRQVPGTISCSRDSVKPAEFRFFQTPSAKAGLTVAAEGILERADWLLKTMQERVPGYQAVKLNDRSNTLYFREPSERIRRKYSLATMRADINGTSQPCAHVVVMPHADYKVLNAFVDDLARDAPKIA